MSRKNCTDIFKTHTSLLVQFLLWQAAKPSGDNCTPWRQLHPLETTAPPGTTALPGKPAPPLISLRF